MDFSKATKVRSYELPIEFWEGLLQVRNYLISDKCFFNDVFGYPPKEPLASAFYWVEFEFEKVWQEWHFDKH